MLYSGLICCFDVLKRARGFPVACSPRWTPLKGAFSSFQHLGLLQIPGLSNFKEICLQNSRIIVFTFSCKAKSNKATQLFYETWTVVVHDREVRVLRGFSFFSWPMEAVFRREHNHTLLLHLHKHHCLTLHASLSNIVVCEALSWKLYSQLLSVIAITDARMTKQAAIQTFTYLCTSLAKKFTQFQNKNKSSNIHKHKCDDTSNHTPNRTILSYTSCCFICPVSVFIRSRHKDERSCRVSDNMWTHGNRK